MKTTKNERLGLVALTVILAAIVAMAIYGVRTADNATVPVSVIDASDPATSAKTDTAMVNSNKKPAGKKREKKRSDRPRPDMRRDPFEHHVTPE